MKCFSSAVAEPTARASRQRQSRYRAKLPCMKSSRQNAPGFRRSRYHLGQKPQAASHASVMKRLAYGGEAVTAGEWNSGRVGHCSHDETHDRIRRAARGRRSPGLCRDSAWIFDLDNTLYPRSTNLFQQVDDRIRAYVRDLLNVGRRRRRERIQKGFYREHGTTLRGLMLAHDVDPDEFLAFVHDIDHSALQPDPALGAAILRLPGKKYIFTNGSRRHAEKLSRRSSGLPITSRTSSTSSPPISCRSRNRPPTTVSYRGSA